MVSFSAVLLAGGQSIRMGCDKALLPLPGSNLLLWQRQLSVLEELRPEKIIWSGSRREGVPAHLPVVLDAVEKAGPLAGISACLDILDADVLVVLAVDLPQMSAVFLQRLLVQSSTEWGAVAQHGDFFEPLAAVYPKRIAPLAKKYLKEGRYVMQELVREAARQGFMRIVSIDEHDLPLFKNLNTPVDLY